MRIRSIKPEFWRSEDITNLSIEDRLLFIGLWSYVDDNGVGVDKLAPITADLFAGDLERDPRETFARVSRGLQNLSEAGRIVRYEVDGKHYLEIANWAKHQRIDKPNKPRYPHHDADSATIRDILATSSRDSRETPAPGTEEQGNRGTEEQSRPRKRDSAAKADAAPKTPADRVATDVYEQTNRMVKYIAVRNIANKALGTGASPDKVTSAMLDVYRRNKPITLETVGQALNVVKFRPTRNADSWMAGT